MSTTLMGPVDAAWLHMDQPTNLMVITSVMALEGSPDWDAVVEVITDRVVNRFPRFRQRVTDHRIGPARWVDDHLFDPQAHFLHVRLPQPGGRTELQGLVGDLMGQDLDHRRPLWQIWLIDGYEGGAAMVVRVHHCVADGIALAHVLGSLLDETATEPAGAVGAAGASTATSVEATRVDGVLPWGALGAIGRALGEAPARVAAAVHEGAGVLRALVHDTVLPPDSPTAFKGPQSTRKVVAWTDDVSLAAVKDAAHRRSATVNDLLMAALSGSLADYLASRDGDPVEEIHAMVPVNLRPSHDLPDPDLGNRFGLVICPLPVGPMDPEQRLRAVRSQMEAIKATPEAVTSLGLLATMGATPPAVERVLADFFAAKTSLVLSNVPGPRTPVSMAGTPVRGVVSWAPQSGPVSMSVTIFSYAGQVGVGAATDPALVPDPHRITDGFVEHLRAYLDPPTTP